jgi:hypothetical protein
VVAAAAKIMATRTPGFIQAINDIGPSWTLRVGGGDGGGGGQRTRHFSDGPCRAACGRVFQFRQAAGAESLTHQVIIYIFMFSY